jgi:hypothetical protein
LEKKISKKNQKHELLCFGDRPSSFEFSLFTEDYRLTIADFAVLGEMHKKIDAIWNAEWYNFVGAGRRPC